MPTINGIGRRKKYLCSGCLQAMWEHPALVVDSSAMRCPDCERADDPKMTDSTYVCLKRYYAKPKITNTEFAVSILPGLKDKVNIENCKKGLEK